MAEELVLDYLVDQPNIPTANVETQVKILLRVNASNALRSMAGVTTGVNLCLVLDCSSSMRDAEFRAVIAATKAIVDALRPIDTLSVVAFQNVVYEIVTGATIADDATRAEVKRKIDTIENLRGGGTELEFAITKAEMLLNAEPDPAKVKKILIMTDGQVSGVPANCLRTAREASERKVSFDCLGFGAEFDYGFCQTLVAPSNGFTDKIERVDQIVQAFQKRVQNLMASVAINATLTLSFTPTVRAGRIYRYSPEMAFMGNVDLPGDSRDFVVTLGAVEKEKEYAYVVTATVPARSEGNIRIIKATLRYDLPALNVAGGESQQSVVVFYSGNAEETAIVNGQVVRAFDEVEIARLVEELDRACQASDHKRAAMFFDILARRYEEMGNLDLKTHYGELKAKYQANGRLSLDDMNYSRHASTQKKDSGVKLVDASSLI